VDIVVLIKQVPDTATRVQDRVKDGQVDLEGVTWVVNPYDEYAVEEALLTKERLGGTVTLVTMGPERAESALKDMLALGADEAVLLTDPAFEGLGPRGTAQVLAAAVRKLPHEMVWTGWKGVDNDQGLVPIYLAQELDYPHVSFVSDFELDGSRATAKRDVEGGKEVLETDLPAVFTAQKGLNEVRYASLKGIMAVKRKQIPVWDAAELGLDTSTLAGSAVETVAIERPPERQAGRVIEGAPAEAAGELVKLLHEEAKVI
jgi:electron transfer flavoprotein beta subunit